MSGIDNPIIFYPLASLLILFTILTISARNIFRSLLSAIAVFFFAGLLFYILGSEYNAIIQVAIYGVAVPVVLGLAIMFTNLKKPKKEEKASNMNYLLILAVGLFILTVIYLMLTSLAIMPVGFNVLDEIGTNAVQSISAFGSGIFVRYVWAFEIISLILTIVVVGLTLFRRINKCKK
jgi:NADH:ubiquinone oxidoreductase subunit 6 (subunit J)